MATSLIAKPQVLSPAFNPLRFIYDSTNKNLEGFRYIFDIYEAGTANKIDERKPMPNFGDGYGETDLSKLLQGFLSGDFDPTNSTTFDALKSYYRYDVKVGEEYVQVISYTASLVQNGSFVKITATHSFVVGDTVVINQDDGGAANPSLEGLFVVTAVTGTTDFTVNSLWSEVTDATIDGEVRYSDNRKVITRDIVTSTGNLVFNGAFSFVNWIGYQGSTYQPSSTVKQLLTDLPDDYTITDSQDIWVNVLNETTATWRMRFENDNGDIFDKAINSAGHINQVYVAGEDLQGSLSVVSGSGDLVKADTQYYDFWVTNAAGTQITKKYRLTIDTRCRIYDYQLAFRDRKGSILSFAFQLHDEQQGQVKRTTYNKKVVGSVTSQQWGYSSIERGFKSVDISQMETLTLRANHIKSQDKLNLWKQLITSPDVYIKIGDDWQAVTIEDTSYNIPRLRQSRLHTRQVQVKLSNQDIING